MFKIVQMNIESKNVEASTNALPFAKRMLGDVDCLKLALDAMCYRNGSNEIITETGTHINHTNQYIIRVANYFNIELAYKPSQKELDKIINGYRTVFKAENA